MSKNSNMRHPDIHKLLFLDIDGVLNSSAYYNSDRYKSDKIKNRYFTRQYDIKKLELLKEIVKKTHCTIVMSSSWRGFYFDKNCKSRMGNGCMRLKRDLKRLGIVIRYRTGNEYNKELYEKYTHLEWYENENGVWNAKWNIDYKTDEAAEIKDFYDRGFQINNFLKAWERKHGKCNYAILDDDDGDLHLFGEHFVQTNWGWQDAKEEECGLQKEHVEKCIKLLNEN